MDKQQQVLEMAKDICRVKHICNDVCKPISACDALKYAERAVEAGYVKQSELAREIFEEIEFDIHQLMFDRDETRAIAIEGIIANLKKKYTEGQK